MIKDERMKALYKAVRDGVTVCDVGTDHALIPIELILNAKAPKCIITDISAPSLEKGVRNAKKAGCGDKITAFCTNGTLGAPLEGETDIIIAGMGGELISEIIEQDERLKAEGFRFVLQPMSKAEMLRKYLADKGFLMTDEIKTKSCGRVYAVISCRYSGERYTLTDKELWLGKFAHESDPLEAEYAERVKKALNVKLKGLESAEERNEEEITELKRVINSIA